MHMPRTTGEGLSTMTTINRAGRAGVQRVGFLLFLLPMCRRGGTRGLTRGKERRPTIAGSTGIPISSRRGKGGGGSPGGGGR